MEKKNALGDKSQEETLYAPLEVIPSNGQVVEGIPPPPQTQ